MRQFLATILVGLMVASIAASSRAQSDDERYTIMRPERPEPWLAPKYKTPRSVRQPIAVAPAIAAPRRPEPLPPIVVPETGRLLPNLPDASRSETAQDRAMRCAHQAGVYGRATGDRNAYVGSCINQ
jgi:hypothetical protein